MWLVFAIGVGILALSLFFAGRIQRLRVYTVSQMLELRYGPGSSVLSGVVMFLYTLMLSVTSTIAYATIFSALFDIGRVLAIILGGSVVIIYSTLGGMKRVYPHLTNIVVYRRPHRVWDKDDRKRYTTVCLG